MSRRNSSSSQTVSLFPFLAVLVCVLGSLIFLLLATTKRLRDIAAAEKAAISRAIVMADSDSLLAETEELIPRPEPVLGTPGEPVSLEAAAEPSLPEPAPSESEAQRQLEQEWRDKLKQLEVRREQLRAALRQQMREQQLAKSRIADLEASVGDVETRLRGALAQAVAAKDDHADKREIDRLEQEIIALRKKLRLLQNRPTEGNSKFAVVPFDARSGTTRRPILIECTEDSLRFVSEEIVLTPADLEGFTDRYNPLLAGTAALVQYWTLWNRQQPHPDREPEPYVLLIVRPGGTVAYYVAMRMLASLPQPFGYELVEDSIELQPPPTDELAKDLCRRAVEQLLSQRSNVMAQARDAFRGRKSNGGGSLSSPSGNKFQVSDVLTESDEVGERSWENPDRYLGRKPDGDGFSPQRSTPSLSGQPASTMSPGSATGPSSSPSSRSFAAADPNHGASHRRGSRTPSAGSREQPQRNSESAEPNRREFTRNALGSGGLADNAKSESSNPPRLLPQDDPEQIAAANLAKQRSARRQGKRSGSATQSGDLHLENLSRRHWGQSQSSARIGIEQDVKIHIDAQTIVVAGDRVIRYDLADPALNVFFRVMDAVDAEAQTWGEPRPGFYWTPRLKFVVSPGGNQMFERIDPLLMRSGISTSREFTLEAVRPSSEEVLP
jgi:hypothetical protein